MIGKTVCLATKSDFDVVCGTDHLCASIKAGIEGKSMLCLICLIVNLILLIDGVSCW